MKTLKFEDWKDQNITEETKKEIEQEKRQKFISNKPKKQYKPKFDVNDSPELKKAKEEYYKMTDEERKEVDAKAKAMMDWAGEQFFLMPILLKINNPNYTPTLQDMGMFGGMADDFCKKFDASMAEFTLFCRIYKQNILKSLETNFGEK